MASRRALVQLVWLCLMGGIFAACAAMPGASGPKQELVPHFATPVAQVPTAEPPQQDLPAKDSEPAVPQTVNILLLGVDSWDTLSGRSDAIVVVSVDLENERVLLTSVPRDLYVSLDGLSQPERINAAYAQGGVALARAALERVLDVEIPYYAVVNFNGFARIIDTLGGVTINVPEDIIDLDFPAADGINYEPFVILEGMHHLDGETALKYARTRKASANGDFSRMDRQQQVLRALKAQALTPRTLLQIPGLYREFANAVDSNLSLEMIVRLARLGIALDGKAVQSYAIDEASGLVTIHAVNGMSVLRPDLAGIRAAFAARLAALSHENAQVVGAAGS